MDAHLHRDLKCHTPTALTLIGFVAVARGVHSAGFTAVAIAVDTISVTGPETCANCGGPLWRGRASTGRPRVYCSDYCRKAAWGVRRGQGAVAVRVEVVERVVVQEHNLAECSRRCCQSPVAATNMLYALLKLAEAGELEHGAKWGRAWLALQTLRDAVGPPAGRRR